MTGYGGLRVNSETFCRLSYVVDNIEAVERVHDVGFRAITPTFRDGMSGNEHLAPVSISHLIAMSIASSSSTPLRALRGALRPAFSIPHACLNTYTPARPTDDVTIFARPRPPSPTFFTGRPTYHSALETLNAAVTEAQASLRAAHVFPLPSSLPSPQPPAAAFHSASTLSRLLGTELRTNSHRKIMDILNELHSLRYIAELSDQPAVVDQLDGVLKTYERPDTGRGESSGTKAENEVDQWGRAYGMGRRKESSARVWIVPSAAGRKYLDADPDTTSVSLGDNDGPLTESPAEVLVNHIPLSLHFPRITDRETILRPLRLSGLLGAFNVFALTRGGGTSGQAGAVGLALARALVVMRPETYDVLHRGGSESSEVWGFRLTYAQTAP